MSGGGSTGAPPAGSVILRGDLFFREFKENLRKINKDEKWLRKEVGKFNINPEDALVVTYDGKGQIFCQEKN